MRLDLRQILYALVLTGCCVLPALADDQVAQAETFAALSVADLARSKAWYQQHFGMSQVDESTDPKGQWRMANLRGRGFWIELVWSRTDQTAVNSRGFFKVGRLIDDAEALADQLEQSGLPRPKIVDDHQHQLRIVQIQDPDGNLWQFQESMRSEAALASPSKSAGADHLPSADPLPR